MLTTIKPCRFDRPLRVVCRRRGAALLEVIFALTILLLAMGVIGMAFRNGQVNMERSDRLARAMAMTERLVVEMDSGLLELEELEQSGWFGEESIPGLSWRVEVVPEDQLPELLRIAVHVYLGDPDGTEDERQHVLTTHVYRMKPRGIDFERDFGFDQDQIDQLTEVIPGGAAVFDPQNFDPRALAQLDMETLIELLPELIQAFGGGLVSGEMGNIIQAVQSGDTSALGGLANQLQNQQGGNTGGDSGNSSDGKEPRSFQEAGGGRR